jgi:hypothetical protein
MALASLSLQTIKEWAGKNPHSAVTLKRTPLMLIKPSNNEYIMETYKFIPGPSSWTSDELAPAGIISYILWSRDPLFRVADKLLKRQIYNESILKLQFEMESKISGTKFSRSRRRLVEVLNSVTGTGLAEKDKLLLQEVWAHILGVQFVKISTGTEGGRYISFIPSVETWSPTKKIIFVDSNFNSVFIPPADGHERKTLSSYISAVDAAGWTIEWPLADGSKEELDAAVIPFINIVTVPEKAKKAELALIVGRCKAMAHLINLSNYSDSDLIE